MGGLQVPGIALLGISLIGLMATLWLVKKWDLEIWQGTLLILVVFLALYSHVELYYYILPVALLSIWTVDDRKMLLKTFLLYIPFFVSLGFTSDNRLGHPVINEPWSWAAGLVLTLVGTLMLIDLAHQAFKKKPFINHSKKTERKDPTYLDD